MLPGLQQGDRVTFVVPHELAGAVPLLTAEIGEFETALGVPVVLSDADPGTGPRWLMSLQPVDHPRLEWVSGRTVLRSTAADAAGLFDTLQLLHTVVRTGGATAYDAPATSRDEVIGRVVQEIGGSFPALRDRGIDWPAICTRHERDVVDAADPFDSLQRWVAELGDVHTSIHRAGPVFHPPYAVRIDDDVAMMVRVPAGTAAHRAGARAGWHLTEPDAHGWFPRTGAPSHARALVAGRRMIAVHGAAPRRFSARSPGGEQISWTETLGQVPTVRYRRLAGGYGYLCIAAWTDPSETDRRIDTALAELADCARLVVDLRGNTGGSLVLAQRTRDRFLRVPTELGSIAYSTGDGRLGERHPLWGRPLSEGSRWQGDVVVLTDALTCSASEDFLLGLHGLPHITTAGEPSCGGSGRPRSVMLTPDLALSISTALTYDREGRCVEGNGLPVDRPGPAFDGDHALDADALLVLATS